MTGDERIFEASKQPLTAEEQCLTALFDMADVDEIGAYQSTSEFFAALNGYAAPEDLRTNIHPHRVDKEDRRGGQTFPEGADVVATVSVGFDSRSGSYRGLHNIDFVRTEQGMKAYDKEWFFEGDERVPRYVRTLDEAQLSALAADASRIVQTIIDTDAERLKLGTLVEEAGQDGLRRFHVGDILSVITGRLVSARGMDGLYDLLGYMTNDAPFTHQLGRFAEECKPYLQKQFDEKLAAYYELPEEALTDAPSVYRWLGEVARTVGEPLLTVQPITEEQHARLDPMTELELDHGSEFMKKVIPFEIEPKDPEES